MKKILTLTLVIALVLGSFVACDADSDAGDYTPPKRVPDNHQKSVVLEAVVDSFNIIYSGLDASKGKTAEQVQEAVDSAIKQMYLFNKELQCSKQPEVEFNDVDKTVTFDLAFKTNSDSDTADVLLSTSGTGTVTDNNVTDIEFSTTVSRSDFQLAVTGDLHFLTAGVIKSLSLSGVNLNGKEYEPSFFNYRFKGVVPTEEQISEVCFITYLIFLPMSSYAYYAIQDFSSYTTVDAINKAFAEMYDNEQGWRGVTNHAYKLCCNSEGVNEVIFNDEEGHNRTTKLDMITIASADNQNLKVKCIIEGLSIPETEHPQFDESFDIVADCHNLQTSEGHLELSGHFSTVFDYETQTGYTLLDFDKVIWNDVVYDASYFVFSI